MRIQIATYTNKDDNLEGRIYFNHGSAFPYTVEMWDMDADECALAKTVDNLDRAQSFARAFCGEGYSVEV
jgi:hypothetical protein